jgi:hypothetical protein
MCQYRRSFAVLGITTPEQPHLLLWLTSNTKEIKNRRGLVGLLTGEMGSDDEPVLLLEATRPKVVAGGA